MNNNSNASNSNRSGDEGGGRNGRPQTLLFMVIAALIMMMVMSYMTKVFSGKNSEREITYDQFVHLLDHHYVSAVTMQEDKLSVKPKKNEKDPDLLQNKEKGTLTESQKKLLDLKEQINKGELKGLVTGVAEDETTLTGRCLKEGIQVQRKVPDSSSAILNFFAVYVLPILLMWGLLTLLFRRMGKNSPFSVGRSNAKVYVQKETGVTFKDVAGEDEAKESLAEVVDFLHNPGKYGKIGAKLPKGALLVGPPGTGKTLLAKAVAGEAHVPFFSLAGSDFIELYVGVGASRVRDLFKEATKNAPCIIFIDEIDAIGRSRDSKYGGGNEEREQTLNQLLSEMDGFDSSKGVLILGATNRPEILDKALLRPGRFDRRIIVDKPDLKGREEILRVHARDVKMDQTVDLKAIALATSGAVGSDLANMINEAAINAVKAKREYVCQKDLMDAVEQVLVGKEKKDRILSKEERKIVSYHEIGHALIAAVQKNTEPVQKITIVPRTMGALGYVMQVPEDEKFLKTQVELHDEIVVTLGGRAAEELIFNTVTTGAENDIEK
ncbi:MAG: ATP-dependent metallopeptidase FtsH/Yme1/Tma family protein, partial [Lachnospiraceae bacterium]|nr:ATP-dependent metallopeptidase FtsH/Yme1/Tma family protein [Lachnospiraceae bacterium]